MPTYARPVTGSIANVVALAGGTTAFNMKVEGFRLVVTQEQENVSGFGDDGNTYYSPGISHWAGAASGFLLTGSSSTLGVAKLTGAQDFLATGTFYADSGRSFTGSCRVTVANIDANYKKGGASPVSIQFVGEGGITEA